MAPTKELSRETITQIIALKKVGHQTKETAELVVVVKQNAREYGECFKEENNNSLS